MYPTVPYLTTEHMGMSRFSPGRLRVFWTEAVAVHNGQRTGSPVDFFVFLSILSPFFWSYNFRYTTWYWKVPGSLNSIISCCNPQNSMFRSLISCDFLYPFFAFTYLQDIPVKNDPSMGRVAIDICMAIMAMWNNWLRKKGVKYFSWFVNGSLFL